MAWAFLWPIAWIAYTFIRGAVVHWYPYPFLDVDEVGYRAAIGSTLFVVLAIVLVAIFSRIDRTRTIGGTPQQLHMPITDRAPAPPGES